MEMVIEEYIRHQLKLFFLIDEQIFTENCLNNAIARTNYALSHTNNKYYTDEVSVYNSVQYMTLLYFLSNEMCIQDNSTINAEKVYYLNKVTNACDIFCQVEMPKIFSCEHPVGSVMGRAKYSDYFFFYQGCTVGGSNGYYPEIGNRVIMYSDSKILGKSKIGNNVILGANTVVLNEVVPDNCYVFGISPNLVVKKKNEDIMLDKISHFWKL